MTHFLVDKDKRLIGIVTCGGDTYRIRVGGKTYFFEWHHYCGPVALKPNGDARKHQPEEFLFAASQWAQQGKKHRNKVCIYDPNIPLKP